MKLAYRGNEIEEGAIVIETEDGVKYRIMDWRPTGTKRVGLAIYHEAHETANNTCHVRLCEPDGMYWGLMVAPDCMKEDNYSDDDG